VQETTAQESGPTVQLPGIELAALTSYLGSVQPGMVTGPLKAELIVGGRSNLTYFISDSDQSWVLRRPPLGHVLATAHDMSREYRIISALRGTAVPVAQPVLFCDDESVLGAPFYVMARVDGIVVRSLDDALTLGAANIPGLSFRLMGTLASLHSLEPGSVGLRDFGRPDGFLERQTRRWTQQLDASRSRFVPGIDELVGRLSRAIPTTQRAGIVHGDYRLDNVIAGPAADGGYAVAAVVDWEMSTLGDPLTDIGLFCVYWAGMGSDFLIAISADADAHAPFPTTADMVDAYAETSGLDMTPLPWYTAFGAFKLAVILEGIHYRHSIGKTVGSGFAEIGELVTPLVERGLADLDRSGIA
jgi:aminoglycoside phosphotransferase (APT) family kinase protein